MADVDIRRTDETDTGYVFDAAVSESGRRSDHRVHLTRRDFEDWAWEGASPEQVAQRCTELLVERVQQDDLMDTFDLREALQLYPAFEQEVRKRLV